MTRDEAKKILGENATEEQVTNLLNNFHNVEKSKNEEINNLKGQLEKLSDYNEIKTKLDNIEKANMTREEQIALMEKTAKENLAKSNRILNTTKAKEILAGLDLDEETIAVLVSDDEQATINNATKLKAKFDSVKETVAKQTKESLTKLDLKPSLSNVNQNEGAMNIDKFMSLSAEEQEKFINDHPEEFEKL